MEGWAKWVRGIEEDTCWNGCWVLYVGDESLDLLLKSLLLCMLTNLDINKKKKLGSSKGLAKDSHFPWLFKVSE